MSEDIESALRSRLLGFPGVAALIGTKIYPDPAPQDAVYPFLVYYQQSEIEEQGLAGSHGLIHPRITFKAWAKPPSSGGSISTSSAQKQVRDIIAQVRTALVGYPGPGGARTVNGVIIQGIYSWGRQNGEDPDSKACFCSIDLEVWYTADIPTF